MRVHTTVITKNKRRHRTFARAHTHTRILFLSQNVVSCARCRLTESCLKRDERETIIANHKGKEYME